MRRPEDYRDHRVIRPVVSGPRKGQNARVISDRGALVTVEFPDKTRTTVSRFILGRETK